MILESFPESFLERFLTYPSPPARLLRPCLCSLKYNSRNISSHSLLLLLLLLLYASNGRRSTALQTPPNFTFKDLQSHPLRATIQTEHWTLRTRVWRYLAFSHGPMRSTNNEMDKLNGTAHPCQLPNTTFQHPSKGNKYIDPTRDRRQQPYSPTLGSAQ